MILSYLKYFLLLVLLIFIQDQLIHLIAISPYNIAPDIVVIAVAYIGIKKGQIFGAVTGFFAGLILDILGGSFLGLAALSYSLAGFTAGYFCTEEDRFLQKYNFLIVIFLCSFVSNMVYFYIYFQGAFLSFFEIFVKYVITTSTYTTIISSVYVIIPRRGEAKKVY